MPILGMTDRKSSQPRLTSLGTVRKGTRDKNGTPIDLAYFRFVPQKGPNEAKLKAIWDKVYGAEPTSIELFLLSDDAEKSWSTWMESYGTNGLKFRCNGKYWVQWRKDDLSYERDYATAKEKLCPYCSGAKERTRSDPGDVAVGYLSAALIPFLDAGMMGSIKIVTTSINDITSIDSSLRAVEELAIKSRVPLTHIGFSLIRTEEDIYQRFQDRDGAWHKKLVSKSMVHLMPDPTWVKSNILAGQKMALAGMQANGTLPALAVSTEDQSDVVDADFVDVMPEAEKEPVKEEAPKKQQPADQRKSFPPRKIMETLKEHVDRRRGSKFSYPEATDEKDERGTSEWKIDKCLVGVFGEDVSSKNAFLQFTLGEVDPSMMDDAEVETLRRYLVTKKVGDKWVLDPAVVQEINDIVALEQPDEVEVWQALDLPGKLKFAEGLTKRAVESGMQPMSYTEETVDNFIATVLAMLSAQDE